MSSMTLVNLSNQVLGDCLNPYKTFCSLHPWLFFTQKMVTPPCKFPPLGHHAKMRFAHQIVVVSIQVGS